MLKKFGKRKNIFCTGPPPPPELHISSETKSKFHVPGYMKFAFCFTILMCSSGGFSILGIL